jgi:hypothetical protein
MVKGDFSSMFALVLATTYGELDGLRVWKIDLLGLPKELVRATIEAATGL